MAQVLKDIKKNIGKNDVEGDISGLQIERITPEIRQYLESLDKLEVLVMSNCGLTSLANFPTIKSLQALDLSNNELTDDSEIQELLQCNELTQIFFNNNQIKNLQTIMKLKTLPKLIEIDCEGNDVSNNDQYAQKIFEQFQTIQIVDKKDKDGNAIEEEEQFDEDEFDDDEDQDQDDEEFDEDSEEQSEPLPKKKNKQK